MPQGQRHCFPLLWRSSSVIELPDNDIFRSSRCYIFQRERINQPFFFFFFLPLGKLFTNDMQFFTESYIRKAIFKKSFLSAFSIIGSYLALLSVELNWHKRSQDHWKLRPCTTARGRLKWGWFCCVWLHLHEHATWREQASVDHH